MAHAGYSGTPLHRKLGLKDGQRVAFVGLPDGLAALASAGVFATVERLQDWQDVSDAPHDLIHLFTTSSAMVDAALPVLRDRIARDGIIWVSWPKKASKIPTDVTEDAIRNRALADVLVDVKVCAVNEVWSGLKLVIRKELRG
ncbi:MAG: hypothetical protein NTX73_18980 [Rhodobacterales bacterium]|nr:hypothetical protein [Rhodobacterales bacterium]